MLGKLFRRRRSAPEAGALQLIQDGSALAGGVVGAATTFVAGPIAGAAAGSISSAAFRQVGEEVNARYLAPRQRLRAGACFAYAANEISARIMNGEGVREDRFFEADGETRSTAEEILEGVLLRASDCYEERRLVFLARLYAGTVFC